MTATEIRDLLLRPLVLEPSSVEALLGLLAALVVLTTLAGLRRGPPADPEHPGRRIVEASRGRARVQRPAWLGVQALLLGAAGHATDLGVLYDRILQRADIAPVVFRWCGALLAGAGTALLGFAGTALLAARRSRSLPPEEDVPSRGRLDRPDSGPARIRTAP